MQQTHPSKKNLRTVKRLPCNLKTVICTGHLPENSALLASEPQQVDHPLDVRITLAILLVDAILNYLLLLWSAMSIWGDKHLVHFISPWIRNIFFPPQKASLHPLFHDSRGAGKTILHFLYEFATQSTLPSFTVFQKVLKRDEVGNTGFSVNYKNVVKLNYLFHSAKTQQLRSIVPPSLPQKKFKGTHTPSSPNVKLSQIYTIWNCHLKKQLQRRM